MIITRETLKDCVHLAKIITDKSKLENLQFCKITNKTIEATNLEQNLILPLVTIEAEEPLEAVVSTKQLLQAINACAGDTCRLTVKGDKLGMVCDSAKFTFNTVKPEDFPEIERHDPTDPVRLESEEILEAIRRTKAYTTQEESRFDLAGIKIKPVAGGLDFVASDGRRMALYHVPTETPNLDIMLPEQCLSPLQSILHGPAEIYTESDKRVWFRLQDGTTFSTALLRDKFPPYERIFPTESNFAVTMPHREWLHGVSASLTMALERGQMIRIKMEPHSITFRGESTERGLATYKAEYQGPDEPIEIGLRGAFLRDYLRTACTTRDTTMHILDDERAIVLTDETPSYKALIMPMSLAGERPEINRVDR